MEGGSIRILARLLDCPIYGFDSFKGLPEDWTPDLLAGHFATKIPKVPPNVQLFPGLIADTLPLFLSDNSQNCALAHIDTDLYSSCKTILENLRPRLKGSLLMFDEMLGPNNSNNEKRAWKEFSKKYQIKYKILAICGERVAVQIL